MSTTQKLPQPMAHPEPLLDFKRVPVESISFPWELYDATIPESDHDVMLLPPLIVTPTNEGYSVIDGCKRLFRARSTGVVLCDCGIVSPVPSEIETALLRIRLNYHRQFSLREKYLFSRWLHARCDTASYQEACMLYIPDRSERSSIERLITCNDDVVEAVFSGTVDLSYAADINRLDQTDRKALLTFLAQFPFSRQTQKELIEWLPELAFREKCTISAICTSTWIQDITGQQKLNAPQKIDKLRQTIYNRRFPIIAKTKKTWMAHATAINPASSAVVFKPSEAFEKNRLEIKITITSPEQAHSIFSQLSALEPDAWNRLIYPASLYGDF